MRNPFRPNKFELHSRPLIWVAPAARRVMQETGSFYIAGARGSGKTSILKALDSIERVENETLREQIRPFKYNTVGVYMRAQDLFTQSYRGIDWGSISRGMDEKVFELFFLSSLIEGQALSALARTASIWRTKDLARYRLTDAVEIAAHFQRKFPRFFTTLDLNSGDPIFNLSEAASTYRKSLSISLIRGDGDKLADLFVDEPLDLLREATSKILPLFDINKDENKTLLKVAIDECDYLSPNQQVALNTLVRKTRAPIDFVIAYVDTNYDPTTTLFENLALSEADRQVIPLANENETDFADLCEAIVSYRTYYSTPPHQRKLKITEIHHSFNLQKKLGTYGVNDLIQYAFSDSISDRTKRLITRAKLLREQFNQFVEQNLISQKTLNELQFSSVAPPIYQQFLIERLGFAPESYLTTDARKEVFLATLRRKQRGALLQILKEGNKQIMPYFGKRIVVNLADCCVRDFLDIMASIFDAAGGVENQKAINLFASPDQRLKEDIQRKGVEDAANSKFNGIKHAPSLEPGSRVEVPDAEGQALTRLIDGLGRLTHLLQTSQDGLKSLSTTERGIFVLDLSKVRQIENLRGRTSDFLESVLRRGVRDNHLIADEARLTKAHSDKSIDSTTVRFRLHRRFSPKFRFSYLGAQEDVALPPDAVLELVSDSQEFSAEHWARRMSERLIPLSESQTGQQDLFLKDSVDDN